MDKQKFIFEHSLKNSDDIKIKRKKGGFVTIINHETGEVIFEEDPNMITTAGSAFAAAKIWNVSPDIWTPTYNNYLGLDHTVNEPYPNPGVRTEEKVFLFAVGIDGCGSEASQVFQIDPSKWINVDNLVPFRYVDSSEDLGDELRNKYFGRKTLANGKIAYYFKAFDSDPVFIQQYTDGTPIGVDIYDNTRKDEIENYIELKMSITKEDCRDYFISNVGIQSAKVNSISLLTAWKKVIDGYVYYQDIRPYTKYNFPNEHLIDISKGIDFIYHIYY